MMTLEEIRKKKAEMGLTNEQLSEMSGVPLGTLQKIMGNVTRSPRYETLKALSAVFENRGWRARGLYDYDPVPDYVREPEAAYNVNRRPIIENTHSYDRQGSYTLEDYMSLPEEQRVELIDGVIYDMGAPSLPHQMIGGEIFTQIMQFVKANKGKCIPFIAPTDVQIDCDNRTIVQPDVMIVCDRSKLNHNRVFGAPDFVAEVLSPSTKNKDILIKSAKYQNAGVREYWMIDPAERKILVMNFDRDTSMDMYTFDDKVPIGIYDGKCVIDFKEISEYISILE